MPARDTLIAIALVLAMLAVYGGAQLVGIPGIAGRVSGLRPHPVAYDAAVEGTAVFRGETGMRTPTGDCLDQLCRPAYSDVTLRVDGLPDVGDDLHYQAYLVRDQDGQPERRKLGELTPDGDAHVLDVNRTGVDGRGWEAIAVVLTASAEPEGEPGPTLHRHVYGPLEEESPPPVNLTYRGLVSVRTPHRFRIDAGAVTFSLRTPSRYPDLTRCVRWVDGPGVAGPVGTGANAGIRIADPAGYEGSFRLQGCSRVQDSWTWNSDRFETADTILVTYEASGGAGADSPAPAGWPLVEARVTRTR